jgi:hypothetical protein
MEKFPVGKSMICPSSHLTCKLDTLEIRMVKSYDVRIDKRVLVDGRFSDREKASHFASEQVVAAEALSG